ncbi:MAG: 3-oxoacyl-[acyl-carrier-protein] reductase [Candidatus Ratteibacteria bacterium]|nr:3-oxoacyl-[acyl-carrier-protein] reductase [Candidatus Ratteibacteria bacterium]
MLDLKDKVAMITGAAQGIGRACAESFARAGAYLFLVDIDQDSIRKTAKEFNDSGFDCLALGVDISSLNQVEEAVRKALDKLKKIDILINNAGITRDALLLRMKEEDWDKVLAVNLKGVFNCTKVVSRAMVKQRAGSIVNIASIIGQIGNAGQANYAASKAGVIGFAKSAARELAARQITVNAIAPGFIKTRMTESLSEEVKNKMLERIPLGRFAEPEEVADLAVFLAGSSARYITGQVFRVDGGMVM